MYDDSPIEDYTKAFPVHQAENAPACVAAVNRIVSSETGVNPDQLHEMQNAGWEIIAHTVTHRAMGETPFLEPPQPGDTKLRVPYTAHAASTGDPLCISTYTGDTTSTSLEVVTIADAGTDDASLFITIQDPVQTSFPDDITLHVRFPERILRWELEASRADLKRHGLEIDNFVYPFGSHGPFIDTLVREYYDAVGNWNRDGLNPGDPELLNPYRIGRSYMRTDMHSLDEIAAFLDEVRDGNLLGMIAGHTYFPTIPAERIRSTIRLARERDIEIVTLRDTLTTRGFDKENPPTSTPFGTGFTE